jgi:hypothetical protein
MGIKELEKPFGVWCKHCDTAAGCNIYASRPAECASFVCGYLANPALGEEWKPSRSKIVLSLSADGKRIIAHLDPDRPDAWKREPFHSALKSWARAGQGTGKEVFIATGQRMFRLEPE